MTPATGTRHRWRPSWSRGSSHAPTGPTPAQRRRAGGWECREGASGCDGARGIAGSRCRGMRSVPAAVYTPISSMKPHVSMAKTSRPASRQACRICQKLPVATSFSVYEACRPWIAGRLESARRAREVRLVQFGTLGEPVPALGRRRQSPDMARAANGFYTRPLMTAAPRACRDQD